MEAKYTIAMSNANISDKALTLAGLFSWHIGKIDQAGSYFKDALQKNANSIQALVGMGWVESEQAGAWLEKALDKSMRDIEVITSSLN